MASMGDVVKVWVITEHTPCEIRCSNTFTAEELCTLLCKKYNISPVPRTLFALRIKGTNYYLKDNSLVLSGSREYELRIRFKIPRPQAFLTNYDVDLRSTYEYYFRQAKCDVNESKVPEIKYPEHRKELLGLGITDMFRAILEEQLTQNDVEKNWKKYIPKIILKKHGPFAKKYASDLLSRIAVTKPSYDADYVKSQYLQQLYLLAPNYLCEEYKDITMLVGAEKTPVHIQVAPFHKEQPGLRLFNTMTGEWVHQCRIDDIVYLTRNSDLRLEVSRRGTPLFLKFKTEQQLSSFISVCDGYYRLMVKWTFNLSNDDITPSLKELQRLKCHGPVGGVPFSYRKLEEKRSRKHGCFILRQCEEHYNDYYVDVCNRNRSISSYRIEFRGDCYIFNNNSYSTLDELIKDYKDPKQEIYLNECIPPSEYDKSQLLLCGEPQKISVRITQAELHDILQENKSPRCLNTKDIQLFLGSEMVGDGGITTTHKGFWSLTDTKKLDVAFKTLQKDKNEYLKDFIELASKWACVQSSAIVRLYGITLSSPTAMVMEYLPYGPFDKYLRENEHTIQPIQLKKVAASLARALWDLSQAGIVHGHIRCRRLLLSARDEDRIVVKLSGPSLHRYTDTDIHWIPPELFHDMSLASKSPDADTWAFATTLWEIFSYGQSPTHTNPVLTAKSYELGSRLLRPARVPGEVWAVARGCWARDAAHRATPQEIMRDASRILHQEYTPEHNPYEEIPVHHMECDGAVSSELFISAEDATSNKSLISDSIPSTNDSISNTSLADSQLSFDRLSASQLLNHVIEYPSLNGDGPDYGDDDQITSVISQGNTIFTMNKKIGSGSYGQVYQGWMDSTEGSSDTRRSRQVAIKRLVRSGKNDDIYRDFQNELNIMKSLKHENVVEILTYSSDASGFLIIMEYLEFGSLKDYLNTHGETSRLNTSHLLHYAQDIARGMTYISSKGIVHRDLAARNILVANKAHVKISDFGLARMLSKDQSEYKLKTARLLPFAWYAPESAAAPFDFTSKSDVWSFGVTVWEIFTLGKKDVPPFDTHKPKERASCFTQPKNCPSVVYRSLMRDCWEIDPNRRPTFEKLVISCRTLIADLS